MPSTIDITKIIELKRTLDEMYGVKLHMHDACGGQYFSVENLNPDGKEYINNFFQANKYLVIFNPDNTEFHLEDLRLC